MPRARLMLSVPAASAAPVPPAHTSACALPSATALAALTIDASGVALAAAAGSALFAIDTGASTTSTSAGSSPSSSRGPNRIIFDPALAAIAAPAATSAGPRSAPLQSTAITGSRKSSASQGRPDSRWTGDEDEPLDATALLVLVVVVSPPGRHDLAARVRSTHRAHPVRPA